MSDIVERLRAKLLDKDNFPRMDSETHLPVSLAREAADEIESLRAENEWLRDDKGCALLEARDEIGRLRTAFRVNMMRFGASDAEINAVLNEQKAPDLSRYNVGSPERPVYECLTCHTQDPLAYQRCCNSPECEHWLRV